MGQGYRVMAVATICVADHPDFQRPQPALQQLIESKIAQVLLYICGLAVTIKHVFVEPTDNLGIEW